jgi:hypothetical protein
VLGLALSAIFGLGGCDVGKKGDVRATGPAPVLMSTSLEKYRQPDGSLRDVVLRPHFVLRFSRPMSPSSISRANFSVSSTGGVASVGFTNIRVDPVERAIVLTVDATLNFDTDYALEIHPSSDPRAALAAVDGAPFVGNVKIPFHTTKDKTATVPEPLDVLVNPCDAIRILTDNCAGSCCHGGLDDASNVPPVEGLSLATNLTIQRTAVGHAAIEVQDPASPGGPGTPVPRNFPYGMPIIAPGSAAGSYLMYKILLRPPAEVRDPAPFDSFVGDVEKPGELTANDLAHRMIGAPMPDPDRFEPKTPGATCSDPAGRKFGALSWGDRVLIRRWIDQGAHACPCGEATQACEQGEPGFDGGLSDTGDSGSDAGTDSAVDASDALEAGDAADASDATD